MFAVPKGDPVIEVPHELVDEEKNPVQFRPYRFLKYVEFFSANSSGAADDPASMLSAFCGIGAAEKYSMRLEG